MEWLSEWVSEFAVVSDNPFIMFRVFTGKKENGCIQISLYSCEERYQGKHRLVSHTQTHMRGSRKNTQMFQLTPFFREDNAGCTSLRQLPADFREKQQELKLEGWKAANVASKHLFFAT